MVWMFLDSAKHRTANGALVDFNPNTSRVSNVMAALAAVCCSEIEIGGDRESNGHPNAINPR